MNEISVFLLKFGTLRSNKAMHYQAACFGVYFHALGSKGASPGLPHLLIGDSFPGRGLETKRELKQNSAIRSMSCHCVLLTAQSSLLTQALTDLPGSRKPVMKPTALTAGNSADPQSFIKLYPSPCTGGASGVYIRCFTASQLSTK